MLPVIALVGRPNVGKSTLFNRLTRTRDALVADLPGLTRDRQYGDGKVGDRPYLVVDTGGLADDPEGVDSAMAKQVWQAVEESDAVMLLVDGRAGLNSSDERVAEKLRRSGKQVFLVVNKTDAVDPDVAAAEFYRLGLGEAHAISASQGHGITSLMNEVLGALPAAEEGDATGEGKGGVHIAIVGRPNVGKSTLVNRILGEERVIAFDKPGTTRDSIFIPFERNDVRYTLIDTAGVRRRSRVSEVVEKFSIIKTLQAIDAANVVVLVLDAREGGVSEQDATLAGYVMEKGRALVVAVNKWDGMESGEKDWVKREIDLKLPFLDFAEFFFISALHGTGVGDLFGAVNRANAAAHSDLSTPELTRVLEKAVFDHQPPLVRGRRIKLRYAHQGGRNPPVIVIHGNQTEHLPQSYHRYLVNVFRKAFRLQGTPVRLELKTGANPFEGRRNTLTPRQEYKRKRMMKHVRKR
jgi:GTP-binding protein